MHNDQDERKIPQETPDYPIDSPSQSEPTPAELADLAAQYNRKSSFIPKWVVDFHAAQAATSGSQAPLNASSPATTEYLAPHPFAPTQPLEDIHAPQPSLSLSPTSVTSNQAVVGAAHQASMDSPTTCCCHCQ